MSTTHTSADFTIQLRDGRAMGVAVAGPSDGYPVFHFHGSGSSRLEVALLSTAATDAGIRLIGVDRPGIGRSDPKAGYRLLDWPTDVAEVADQLSIVGFAVEGISAGGAYALACAHTLPQRLSACGLISSIAPPEMMRRAATTGLRVAWLLGAYLPGLVRLYASLVQRATGSDEASVDRYLLRYASRMGAADAALLRDPETRRLLARAMAESFRQGPSGNLDVVLAETRPWGFAAEAIAFERLFLWHGEDDHVMPVAPARLLAQALPHCTATFYPGDGHFSTVMHHAQTIFHTLHGDSSTLLH